MSKKPRKISRKNKRKRQGTPSPTKKSLPLTIIVTLIILIGGYFMYTHYLREYPTDAETTAQADVDSLRGYETRPTLSPARFVGKIARAYQVARDHRELLDSLYCYCNCKKHFGHKSLLTCYVDTHAVNCSICLDQAFYASSRYRKVGDIVAVRTAVDKRFWRPLR
ncbi:MAG: CYCXC family (seleno)protein [Desulfobacterales bacterium]|jgi:hypothetical protein